MERLSIIFIFTANKIYFEKWPLFGVFFKSMRNSGLYIITARFQSTSLKRKMMVALEMPMSYNYFICKSETVMKSIYRLWYTGTQI